MAPHPTRIAFHEQRLTELRREDATRASREGRVSILRLVAFLGAAAALTAGVTQGSPNMWVLAVLLAALFVVGVVAHARLAQARHVLSLRMGFQEAELARLAGSHVHLPVPTGRAPEGHPYASDIDLTGSDSLLQRIDTTRTQAGERALIEALGAPAELATILLRQGAVEALADAPAFREELVVAAGLSRAQADKLSAEPFFALLERPSLFAQKRWLKPLMFVSAGFSALLLGAVAFDLAPARALWLPALLQGALLYSLSTEVHATLSLLTARLGFADAYTALFRALEQQSFSAPHLVALRDRLRVQGAPPSRWMQRLGRYEGFAQLRTQGPLYIVLNVLTLWDLFCLERIEHFIADAGPHCADWFAAVAELEVCAAFAALRYGDPSSVQPEVRELGGLHADGLVHPLLPFETRVPNDVSLAGPGSATVITGSNMAGKSTLLRAIGLNVALALAGAPVCARSFAVARVRLRASMRIDDSLQRGASYFHAELSRLRTVVGELADGPPVLFLLDELLRGTNAHARHKGARAVVKHLLRGGAMGLVATHDIALSELERELPSVGNVHFTDVFEDGEMRFDYRLRDGVVKTSNALRLLALAGVEVEVDDSLGQGVG